MPIRLTKTLRHDIRGHLNDIHISAETLQMIHRDCSESCEFLEGIKKSVELTQALLDATIEDAILEPQQPDTSYEQVNTKCMETNRG